MTLSDFISCCGSSNWAKLMFEKQPYKDALAMHQNADDIWWSLEPEDWLEAFSKHPQIGQESNAKWSAEEQIGMSLADYQTAQEMARLNSDYYAKFGFIFIVCATGKAASQMLQLIQSRLHNSSGEEIRVAAAEQAKITHLRLDML